MKFNRKHVILAVLSLLTTRYTHAHLNEYPTWYSVSCDTLSNNCWRYARERSEAKPTFYYRKCMEHNNYWTRALHQRCDI